MSSPPIYALMVTGKNEQRILWAREQVATFLTMQQYSGRKHVLIANEHPTLRVIDGCSEFADHVEEIRIRERSSTSLGQVRNRLLDLVPSHAYIMILDDDDWISPLFLVSVINHWKQQTPATAMIQIGNRLNHNINNGNSWQSSHPSGFVHFVADIDLLRKNEFRYLDRNSLEDLSIHDFASRSIWHESPPDLYIRYVHNDNTSLYVDSQQTHANEKLGESSTTERMARLCRQHIPLQVVNDKRCRLGGFVWFPLLVLFTFLLYLSYTRSLRRIAI